MILSIDPPPFVIRDYTGELLVQLRQSTISELPVGQSSDLDARKLITMFFEAGLEFQYRMAYYDMYVPVVCVIPSKRRSDTPDLPENIKVELSEVEKIKSRKISEQFEIAPASQRVSDTFTQNARTMHWQLAQILAGRVEMFMGIIQAGPDNLGLLSKSLSINFVSTLLNIAEFSLDAYNYNEPWARAMISCPAFILGAATTSLSAPLGIGVIGLIATAQNFYGCMENLNHLVHDIHARLERESRLKQLTKIVNKNSSGNYYSKRGNSVDIFNENTLLNSIKSTDFEGDPVSGSHSDDVATFEARYFERPGDYGGTEYCIEYKETRSNGGFESNTRCESFRNDKSGQEIISPEMPL